MHRRAFGGTCSVLCSVALRAMPNGAFDLRSLAWSGELGAAVWMRVVVWTCRMMWHASCRFNHILLLPARPPHARCAALTYSPRVHAMPQTGDERCLKQRRGKLWERVLWMRACAVHRGRIRVAPGRRWVFASAALFGRHLCCHADMPMCCEFLCDAAETREMFRSCSATPGLLMLCALWYSI